MSQAPQHLLNLKEIRNLFDFKVVVYYFMAKHLSRQICNNFQELPYLFVWIFVPIICLDKPRPGSSIPGIRNKCEVWAQ